ncbi:MAG: uroporphyrinogen-III synthase [Amphritea sp.]
MAKPLAGKRILVTRPNHQAGEQAALLKQLGAEPVLFPLLEITPTDTSGDDYPLLKSRILDLDLYQKIIFISANAVHYGVELIDQYWPQLPVGIEWLAIGKKTASALQRYDIHAQHAPNGYNSEALLAAQCLQNVAEQRILIMRGRNGRETLAETLRKRGALVDYADLYRRSCPDYTPQEISSTIYNRPLDAILITSGEALLNLYAILATANNLTKSLATSAVVPSERVARQAIELGFTQVTIAQGPDSQAMAQAVISITDTDELQ